jgi:hypothetical protein
MDGSIVITVPASYQIFGLLASLIYKLTGHIFSLDTKASSTVNWANNFNSIIYLKKSGTLHPTDMLEQDKVMCLKERAFWVWLHI